MVQSIEDDNDTDDDDLGIKLKKKRWGFIASKFELPNSLPIFDTTDKNNISSSYNYDSEDNSFYNSFTHLNFLFFKCYLSSKDFKIKFQSIQSNVLDTYC
ncbi:12892_t:CDS:2 [Entrophospora sp. SA101]|nr:12892_t:CDS:2 [Entrophospora sp. SA101]